MAQMALAPPASWTALEFITMLMMWWVMMLGMMLPAAAPMILMFATVSRRRRDQGRTYVPTAVFAAGYLLAWGGYSLAATLLQGLLERAALLTPMMTSASPIFGGVLFVAAGAYQFTPLKHACLRQCRSPFEFILNRWRDGVRGALAMGFHHGLFCLGCCWAVMALLFVGGVMNLIWVALLAAFVLAEKLFPAGLWVARGGGAGMVLWGCFLLWPALF
jgi:predicted metal-binding membrane protein